MSSSNEDTNIEVDYTAPTDSYRSEDHDRFPEPVVRPTGEAAPSETVEHRSYDADTIEGQVGTVSTDTTKAVKPANASTKVVKPVDPPVSTK